jgi:UDP-4-amino-4,6-dideoxy-N-acetyl-beta-L-altrosamine transaminase
MRSALPYSRQWVSPEDVRRVAAVLEGAWLTGGPEIAAFEEALAAACGARHAVAVSSGTAALHLAYLAADVGAGDAVLTSPITFLASANAALYCGAVPVFRDVEPLRATLSAAAVEERLAAATGSGTAAVRAVVPVHFAGHPCEMDRIATVARAHGVRIIEDACHALGARWQDAGGEWHRVGDCSHADMAVFSFHPVNHITTGEGGAITTNDPALAARLRRLRDHGIVRDPAALRYASEPWSYEMHELGFNYRISDLQCALGRGQIARLGEFVARRRALAARYDAAFATVPMVRPLGESAFARSAYHLYVVRVAERERRGLFEGLRARGLTAQVHYPPVHLQPYYRDRFGYGPGDFPCAEAYAREAISLPLFPAMGADDADRVIGAVVEALEASDDVAVSGAA